ncbi:hypothetical protein CsSME_00016100 [Camellia sinensis var. sinensis]|uniref:transcription repressor OFP1-like n=1 Tax=Camellia sinensis TaxID=4442 RepID=UPI001036DCD7|nr:transcription repressor OFP1-like [Camellia sinensis]
MGNYKFRLSDMMPNAWFYKLRDMSRTKNPNTSHPIKKNFPSPTTTTSHRPQHISQPRYSNPKVSDTHFPDPPRKSSSKKKPKKKTIHNKSLSPRLVTSSSSVSADCSCGTTLNSVRTKPEPTLEPIFYESPLSEFESNNTIDDCHESFDGLASWPGSCSCRVTSSTTDIIIDMNQKSYSKKVEKLDTISKVELPPILTKPVKFKDTAKSSSKFEEIQAHGSLSINIVKENTGKSTKKEIKTSPRIRKPASHSTGVKIQSNSPRTMSKKVQACGRRSVSSSSKRSKSQPRRRFAESFAIVKSSFDPQRDFRESMVEMIVENNIRGSKELEELLACYLSLNSDEYHGLIVKAFQQIWFDMADHRM